MVRNFRVEKFGGGPRGKVERKHNKKFVAPCMLAKWSEAVVTAPWDPEGRTSGGSLVVAKTREEDASARQKEKGGRTLAFPFLPPLISTTASSWLNWAGSHPAQKPWKLSLQVSAPLIPRVGMGKSQKWIWGQRCKAGTMSENIAKGEWWLDQKVEPRMKLMPSTEPWTHSSTELQHRPSSV